MKMSQAVASKNLKCIYIYIERERGTLAFSIGGHWRSLSSGSLCSLNHQRRLTKT